MNQFNPMAMAQNVQMAQAPMGPRAASPMNHPQQMNMGSVPSVSTPHPSTETLSSPIQSPRGQV